MSDPEPNVDEAPPELVHAADYGPAPMAPPAEPPDPGIPQPVDTTAGMEQSEAHPPMPDDMPQLQLMTYQIPESAVSPTRNTSELHTVHTDFISEPITQMAYTSYPHISQNDYSSELHISRADYAEEPHISQADYAEEPHISQADYAEEPHLSQADYAEEPHISQADYAEEPHITQAEDAPAFEETRQLEEVQQPVSYEHEYRADTPSYVDAEAEHYERGDKPAGIETDLSVDARRGGAMPKQMEVQSNILSQQVRADRSDECSEDEEIIALKAELSQVENEKRRIRRQRKKDKIRAQLKQSSNEVDRMKTEDYTSDESDDAASRSTTNVILGDSGKQFIGSPDIPAGGRYTTVNTVSGKNCQQTVNLTVHYHTSATGFPAITDKEGQSEKGVPPMVILKFAPSGMNDDDRTKYAEEERKAVTILNEPNGEKREELQRKIEEVGGKLTMIGIGCIELTIMLASSSELATFVQKFNSGMFDVPIKTIFSCMDECVEKMTLNVTMDITNDGQFPKSAPSASKRPHAMTTQYMLPETGEHQEFGVTASTEVDARREGAVPKQMEIQSNILSQQVRADSSDECSEDEEIIALKAELSQVEKEKRRLKLQRKKDKIRAQLKQSSNEVDITKKEGYVYRCIEDRHEEQEKREETQSGVDMVTPCRDGNSGEDVIPDTDTGDFIDSVPNDILQKRVSLVKQYAWIKEEMMKTSAESIADDLYANGRLSRVDCEAICHCSWRRDAVEQLLKKILMGPNDIFDKFLQSLREPEGNIAETLENTDPTPDEVYVFKLLEKSSLKQCPRPDHTDPRFSLTESDCQTLLFYLNDKNTIDVINNSLLSRFFLSIREHTNICVCSMRSEGRVGELLNTMKLCSDKIFSSLSEILADMKMEHVTMKLERKRQTAMKKKRVQEDNTAEDESSTSAAKQLCVDSDIEHRLVTSMQKSASSLRLHTIDQLGFYVWSVNTGSIVIKLYPINRGSWRRLEENCMSGKIKDCISEVYNNDAIQDLLPEGEYRLQFTIYTIPTDQEGGKKALFHLGTEHEAPQQGVPVSDDGHHDSPIEDYMDLLCEELEISTTLLTLLKEENIVEYNIKEDIDKQGSRSKKIKYLLNQVDRHGNRGYAVLKQHIKEANEDLHKELMTREGVKNMDAQLDTSANVTTLSKATVGHRGPYSKEVFFSGTAILKVEKNVEPTKKEDIDPDTEKRKLEISCPEIINSVCHFTSKSDSNSSTGSDSQVTASKVGESATSIIDVAATAIRYPLGIFDRKIREVRLDILKEQNQPHYKKPNILLLGKSGSGKSTLINNVFQAICGNKYQNAKPGPGMAQSKTLQLTFYENCGVLLEDILREEDELMIRRLIPNLPNMVEGAAVGNADTPELRELLTLLLEGRIGPGTNIRELEKDQLKYGVGYLKRTAATPREELRIHKIVYVQNCWDAAAVDLIKSIKAVTSAPEPKVTDNIFAVINMYAVPMLPGQTRDESRFVRDYYEDFFADVAKQLSIEGSVVFDMLDWRFYKRWRFDNAHLRTLEFLQKLILPGTPEPPPIPPETLD